ncbi:MAG TPA: cell division protein ZapA [Chitinophagaceae bacterium]|nr:cell division protein ZapA [Chitinophagaceae bacterium]HPH30658.1 cell division protein ZapA [Chitinophagaceae bacterium]
MDDLILISALIGDRTYRIKIEPRDEEMVRRTLKTINEKIVEFKTEFAGKDMQDYIAMVMIWLATEMQSAPSSYVVQEEVKERLEAIEKMLDGRE